MKNARLVLAREFGHPTTTWPVGYLCYDARHVVTARVDELTLFADLNVSTFTTLAALSRRS